MGIDKVVITKKGLTSITVGFNEGLNSSSAVNRVLYSVNGAVKKRGKTVFTKRVGIGGLSYDSIHHMVTINLAKPYKGVVQVMINGSLMTTSGTSTVINFAMVVA